MATNSTAIAVFLKTPGFSSLHQGLANTIGDDNASEADRLSIDATASVVRAAMAQDKRLIPYWVLNNPNEHLPAVAQGFKTITQGKGKLSERISQVYNDLLDSHSNVIILNTECPQISPSLILSADILLLNNQRKLKQFVLGRTENGGFYLFGGAQYISDMIWKNLNLGSKNSANNLTTALSQLGQVNELETLYDIHDYNSLKRLGNDLAYEVTLLPGQKNLVNWINNQAL
ncbi:MAG: DUF2064 domain-containing protein [Pseudomonadota bacterium]|nr:DUF2064 domain-containing protein [Pseudomonadota bacterium]